MSIKKPINTYVSKKMHVGSIDLELYALNTMPRTVRVVEGQDLTIRLCSNGWPFGIPRNATAELRVTGGEILPLEIISRAEGEVVLREVVSGEAVVVVKFGEVEMAWPGFVIECQTN